MTTKRFNGKAIYQPTGKAAEYSPWACNFFTGCSNDCEYCYCKRGVLSHVWSTVPKLIKTFASIEPIIDPKKSLDMINATKDVCDLYKVGTMSGRKVCYKWVDMRRLMDRLVEMSRQGTQIYLKDSFLSYLNIKREDCPGKFVNSDYNIFNPKS